MTTTKLNDYAELPDDPAEACRAISRTLLPLTDFARQELIGQFANLVNTLASVEENGAEAWERSRHALALFARKAEEEAEAQRSALSRRPWRWPATGRRRAGNRTGASATVYRCTTPARPWRRFAPLKRCWPPTGTMTAKKRP